MAPSKLYRLHPQAWLEIEAGDEWYSQRSPDAGTEFVAAVSDSIQTIRQAPQQWAKYLYGTRRIVLHRFPFSVVYLDKPDLVYVIAVAHSKRKPGYWKRRI